jgi:hypothetical protein
MNSFSNADSASIGRIKPPPMPVRGRTQLSERRPTVVEYKVSILWGLYTLEKRKVTS